MNKKVLFESLEYLDDDLLERSERKPARRFSFDFQKLAYFMGVFVIAVVLLTGLIRPAMKNEGADSFAPDVITNREENEVKESDLNAIFSYVVINDSNGLTAYITNDDESHKAVAKKEAVTETVTFNGIEYCISIECREDQKQQAEETITEIIREFIEGNKLNPNITEYHY